MDKILKIVFLFFGLDLFYIFCFSEFVSERRQIGVCILEKVFAADINVQSGECLLIINNSKIYLKSNQLKVEFVKNNKIKINNKIYLLPLYIKSKSQKDTCEIDNKIYPMNLKFYTLDNKTFNVVNIVDIETYIEGVVPYEIVPSWTDEMLKVQAVIVRNYALANLGRHKEQGYDLCSDVHCQVYKGFSKKEDLKERVHKVVKETKGIVLVGKDNQKLIQTYYHATCGGATENVSEAWSETTQQPWLISVKCNFCKNSPYYKWSYTITQEKFFEVLRKEGFSLGRKIYRINIISKTKSGRAKEVEVVSENSKFTINTKDLRRILGYSALKSTKIYEIDINSKYITFYGYGWGHGVGLCQWGANEATVKGKNFKEVLEYYYPNTKINKIYE